MALPDEGLIAEQLRQTQKLIESRSQPERKKGRRSSPKS